MQLETIFKLLWELKAFQLFPKYISPTVKFFAVSGCQTHWPWYSFIPIWVGRMRPPSVKQKLLCTLLNWDHHNVFGTWRAAPAILSEPGQTSIKEVKESVFQVTTKTSFLPVTTPRPIRKASTGQQPFRLIYAVLDIVSLTCRNRLSSVSCWSEKLYCVFNRPWLIILPRKFFLK